MDGFRTQLPRVIAAARLDQHVRHNGEHTQQHDGALHNVGKGQVTYARHDGMAFTLVNEVCWLTNRHPLGFLLGTN